MGQFESDGWVKLHRNNQSVALNISYNNGSKYITLMFPDKYEIYKKVELFSFPINLDPHKTNIGWMAFSIPKDIYKQINIDTYHLKLTDIHGMSIEKEEIYIRESVFDDEIRE